MKLLSILPIARGVRKEILTYFSSDNISLGTIVSIPIRKKTIPGIIVESKDALEAKAEIKEMPFAIKKIIRHKDSAALPDWLMKAAKNIAKDNATSAGAVIAALVPKIALENPGIFFQKKLKNETHASGFEILAIQSPATDRFDTYRSIIRESFAKKMSIAVICPTEDSVADISALISKGIEKYMLAFVNVKSKRYISKWRAQAFDASHPMLLVGTSNMLSLLPQSVGTIIIEEESSQFYKQRRQPFLDARSSAREIARSRNFRLIIGDSLLTVEALTEIKNGSIIEYSRIGKRNPHKIQTLLVDMKIQKKDGKNEKEFVVLSPDLKEMISYAKYAKKKLFIYSVRRGISPQTICQDCGTSVKCDYCEAPAVLHTRNNNKIFICHHCGVKRDANETCRVCGGWNLKPFGIGIERIEEEIKLLGDFALTRIDSDVCKSLKDVKTKIKEFFLRSDILLGTDLALRYLPAESVNFVAIVSLDTLFSLPDFRTNERVMHTILDVKSKATENILLQARDLKQQVIEQSLSGDLEGFVKDELEARKKFGYPPFSKIVKLTVTGQRETVKTDARIVAEKLNVWKPLVFPAFIKSVRGQTSLHIMLKLPHEKWPDKKLSDILFSLPQSVKIDTSPQSLL
ncbi:MAG TPA: hypothetical protein VJH63_01120 [Candidatus Paceibacterota bacterium]